MSNNWKNWIPPHHHLIGHRGIAGLAPENTLASFKKAQALGFNWIELDTQPCLTGEWIVIHDDTLERTTNGKGWVCDTPLEKINQLDAGSWFDLTFKNESIPTLKDALQCIAELGLQVNIEIKATRKMSPKHAKSIQSNFPKFNRAWSQGVPNKKDLVISFLKELQAAWPPQCPLPLISSFDLETLLLLKAENKHLPLSYLVEDYSQQALNFCKKKHFFSLNCRYQSLPKEFKAEGDILVLAYTVNDQNIITKLIDSGVGAIFTDLNFL